MTETKYGGTVMNVKRKSGFSPICQNQIQGLFKDFQGPYE